MITLKTAEASKTILLVGHDLTNITLRGKTALKASKGNPNGLQ